MTRLPLENWRVKGLPGIAYAGNAICAAPGCGIVVTSGERHHMWRRSFLAGDYWWVLLPDGEVAGNCIFLCKEHHRQLTKGIAMLSYQEGVFRWLDAQTSEPLTWQPPVYADQHTWMEICDSKPPGKKEATPEWICPSCGRPLPHAKHESEKETAKIRKTWSIAVPVAEQENGAEVLDENLEHARELFIAAGLPYGPDEKVKYYVLSTALALFITHAQEILAD